MDAFQWQHGNCATNDSETAVLTYKGIQSNSKSNGDLEPTISAHIIARSMWKVESRSFFSLESPISIKNALPYCSLQSIRTNSNKNLYLTRLHLSNKKTTFFFSVIETWLFLWKKNANVKGPVEFRFLSHHQNVNFFIEKLMLDYIFGS